FDQKWETSSEDALDLVGLMKPQFLGKNLAAVVPSNPELSPQEQQFLWRMYLVRLLYDHVGGTAGMQVLPAFRDLPDLQKSEVLRQWNEVPKKELAPMLEECGFDPARSATIAQAENLSGPDQEVLWHAYLVRSFETYFEEFKTRRDRD